MPLSANSSWFTLSLGGRDDFAVYAFRGREAVSEPYEFTLDLAHRDASVDLAGCIGAPALLTILDRSGVPRLVHGLVREMRQWKRGNVFSRYQCVVVPRVWFLDQNQNHRIFQNQSVPNIITKILEEQGFATETFAFKCFHRYEPREYCVQYAESDLYFLSRLCEEEGIYYYFEHSASGHCLCFSDMPGGPDIAGGPLLRYAAASGHKADTAVIGGLNYHVAAHGNAVTFREWNFEKHWVDLTVHADEPDFEKAPVPPGLIQEHYRYPHRYPLIDPGKRYAHIQLQREITFGRWIDGRGDVARLLPGYTFVVERHPRCDVNDRWWVTAVHHQGEQPQVLEREAPDRGMEYHSSFQAIPAATRFVPAEAHPKIRIPHKQTAVVTGPEGQEIYPDRFGRVKVQFFWDREGKGDENTTCWIRVSQGWAGSGYGAHPA